MKSLDINFSSANYSDERSRRVVIEFTGGIYSEMMQNGTHTMKVPYSSFSKKLQTIHRLGGKIINVSIPHFQLDTAKVDSEKVDFILEEISAIAPEHPFLEPLESSVETASQKISDISSENIAIVEPISENIVEETIPIVQKLEPLESTVPLSKQKKTKTSTKSNHGFNKPKDDTQEKRSPRKPKS